MTRKGLTLGFWITTAFLCLQMFFTAYAPLFMPRVSAFPHLGFPHFFGVELGIAKLLSIPVLLIPAFPARIKEWAYCGIAITLTSALIAHLAVGDPVKSWSWAVGTFVLWSLSYYFWRRLQTVAA